MPSPNKGDFGLWMSCQHYSGSGRDRHEREHNLPSQWPGQRPHYVAAEIATLVALCDDLPPHRGHPFIAKWNGMSWETVGMVWKDGCVEIKNRMKADKYDRLRRGECKSGYPAGYPSFAFIARDDVPTKYV